jgi:hypothetical protein
MTTIRLALLILADVLFALLMWREHSYYVIGSVIWVTLCWSAVWAVLLWWDREYYFERR